MSGAHSHRHLHIHGSSPIHRLAPEAKLAGLFAFVLGVALTPRTWVLVFVINAVVAACVVALARLKPRIVLVRLAAIIPFVAFAFTLPFFGDGPGVDVGPFALSTEGLWASWNIVAKAALGATASIVVMATTPIPDVLTGLSRLRVPATIVGIVGFMFRYLDLIVDELARMRRAMSARGYAPRWLWQSAPLASSAGTLFVRTYERGERVHEAMLARGFTGAVPELDTSRGSRRDFVMAFVPAVVAIAGLAGASLL